MRPSLALFLLVLALVAVLAVANLDRLFYPITLNLVFGLYQMPAVLTGLLSILTVALLFAVAGSLADTRAKARSADYLRRIDDLRLSLDKEEASRFAALNGNMEVQLRALSSRLDALGDSLAARQDELVASVGTRVDRVRDELAADIGEMEDALLRAQGRERDGSVLRERDGSVLREPDGSVLVEKKLPRSG